MTTALLLATALLAGDVTVRDQIGVNIHFTGAPARDLELLGASGLGWVRMDLAWGGIERREGEYRFERYDELVDGMAARHIRILFILDYSNRLYEEGRSVRTERGRVAFARFAAAAAKRYRGRGVRWEIWNEPNLEQFWKPQPAAADYLALARAASRAVRTADPEARILGPATSGFPWEFLETLFEGGFLDLVDGVSVHPYRKQPPETAIADFARLRKAIERHIPEGRSPAPIVSGEWGYSNQHWGKPISLEQQAAYVAREYLSNIADGVTLSIWYDWANDGTDPGNTEHNFGLVDAAREPKPAYRAAATIGRLLGSAHLDHVVESPEGDHVIVFAAGAGGRSWTGAWTARDAHRITLRSPTIRGALRVVSLTGEEARIEAGDGVLDLSLGEAPVYVELPEDAGALEVRRGE